MSGRVGFGLAWQIKPICDFVMNGHICAIPRALPFAYPTSWRLQSSFLLIRHALDLLKQSATLSLLSTFDVAFFVC